MRPTRRLILISIKAEYLSGSFSVLPRQKCSKYHCGIPCAVFLAGRKNPSPGFPVFMEDQYWSAFASFVSFAAFGIPSDNVKQPLARKLGCVACNGKAQGRAREHSARQIPPEELARCLKAPRPKARRSSHRRHARSASAVAWLIKLPVSLTDSTA
jgi:hypothetical protein